MSGEYFSWLSHDDLYYPEKIEKQIKFISNFGHRSVVYSDYALLKGKRIIPVQLDHEMLTRKPLYSLLRGCINGTTLLIPRAMFEEIGKFDTSLRCTQDYDLWKRAYRKYEFIHMKDIISVTRIHDNQDSVISLNALTEGNVLWKSLVDELSDKEKRLYGNTLYNYYYEMSNFLKSTPYAEAQKYCAEKESLELSKLDRKIEDSLVSVIIPFRNRVDVTINAIKSVENQTYSKIEIVLIDDASDEDIIKLHKYIKNKNYIKIINLKNNVGPAAARNIGIRESSGEYVAFLDSDDEYSSDKLDVQLSAMSKHNPYISYTSYVKRSITSQEIIGGYGMSGIVVPRIISSCPIATPTVIINKKIIEKNNYEFNEKIRIGEDTCFWLEIAKKYEILHVDNALTVVNVDDASSAYDNTKFIVGIRNILAYLLNDSYYSKYMYEISLLCNDFYAANKNVFNKTFDNLRIKNYLKPRLIDYAMIYIIRTIPYRAARMFKRKGVSGVINATKVKVSRVRQ